MTDSAVFLQMQPLGCEPPLLMTRIALSASDEFSVLCRQLLGLLFHENSGTNLACHPVGMVLNQPALSKQAWTAKVNKMINVYKAPVAPEDVGSLNI